MSVETDTVTPMRRSETEAETAGSDTEKEVRRPSLRGPLSRTDHSAFDLRDLLRRLWRRKGLIFGVAVILTSLSAAILTQIKPRYTASAEVMVEPRRSQVVDFEAVTSGLPADQESIQSEIQVLRSRALSARVIEKLGLYRVPEFNSDLRKPPVWRQYVNPRAWIPVEWKQAIFGKPAPLSEEQRASLERSRVIESYLGKLSVSRVSGSRVIRISVTSESSARAQEIANALADLYIVEQLEAKFEATRQATSWLNDRLGELRQEVEQSEQAVEAYRLSSGLTEAQGATLVSQQISELSTQLVLARTQRAEAGARLKQIERLQSQSDGLQSVANVVSSPLIQSLREQEAQLLRRSAELSKEFGDRHPRMINLAAEVEKVRGKMRDEVGRIIQDLRNEFEIARTREGSLSANVGQLEGRLGSLNKSEISLRALEREADANRTLYENFLSRFKELSSQGDVEAPDVRVISYAELPASPSYPRTTLILALSLIGSVFAGVLLASMLERLDHGYRSLEEVERDTGISGIGMIPTVPRLVQAPYDYIVSKPFSALAEAYRSLLVSLQLSNVDSPPKVVLVTSSVVGEGKTATSVSLARTIAKSGATVILVDCDLRRPSVHKALGIKNSPGLVEVLSGDFTIDDVLVRDEKSGACILPAGTRPSNPLDLLNSNQFARVLTKLREASDMVVIDSAPVTVVSDARVLAKFADKTIFMIHWASTRREVVANALRLLMGAKADLAGAALSRVNVRKHSRYGYGDSGYYYGKGSKYYSG